MADIFLSYASQDRERIRPLVNILQQQGWTVWWDRKIPPGKTYDQVIEEALDASACVVVVWSEHSVKSDWVRVEANEGLTRKILVPTLIDKVKPPLAFRLIQVSRLIDWKGDTAHHELEELLDSIKALIGETKLSTSAKRTKSNRISLDDGGLRIPTYARTFKFQTLTIGERGWRLSRITKSAKYLTESLGNGVQLEMVEIPGGKFLMGAPETEKDRSYNEGPQHEVIVAPFAMGKFQITQTQWSMVASLPKVAIDLNSEPSYFKGDSLPVEQISWYDAVEFCNRLSKKTGKQYRLPNEAEWEYACRAGTTSPFHFGPTISPEEVNYNGNYPYGYASRGNYRGKTISVGSLRSANGFGLFDMHGNVWEWCLDVWNYNYCKAPSHARAWLGTLRELLDSGGASRVVRGGSWVVYGKDCRSASRGHFDPDFRNGAVGFRVVIDSRSS